MLPLCAVLGRLDSSSLLTSDQKRQTNTLTAPVWAASCAEMRSQGPITHRREKQSVCFTIIVITSAVCTVKQQADQQGLQPGRDLITQSVL